MYLTQNVITGFFGKHSWFTMGLALLNFLEHGGAILNNFPLSM